MRPRRGLAGPAVWAIACAVLLVSAQAAGAAGIRCEQARSPAETAICGDKDLLKLDGLLASLYAQTARLPGNQRAELAASQKLWLGTQEACAAQTSCLDERYNTRMAELRDRLRTFLAYQPDATDGQALAELRQATENRLKTHGEMGLVQALEALRIQQGMTRFANVRDETDGDEEAHFPTQRPKGVSVDEWRALQQTNVEASGENGVTSYTLLDMDGDGKRDLIVEVYNGGTGLWSYAIALRRHGAGFVSALPFDLGYTQDAMEAALYTVNGRGANQSIYWVRLQGRVYAAYVDGRYGEDSVALLSPLHINGVAPTLSVHYRYTFSIPRKQVRADQTPDSFVLDNRTYAALSQGLARMLLTTAGRGDMPSDKPLCPPPPEVKEDELDLYRSFGPGHYAFEIVGDFPVWYGKECRIGRMINWFGRYAGDHGLLANLLVKKPDGGDTEEEFNVEGRRRVTRIDSGMLPLRKP